MSNTTLDLTPEILDIKVKKGTTFKPTLTLKIDGSPVDLTGCTASLQIRTNTKSDDILKSFATGVATGDGVDQIVLGGAAGTVAFRMTSTETADATWNKGVYEFDITWSDNTVSTLLAGSFSLVNEANR